MPKILLVRSKKYNPWHNLALEQYLVEQMQQALDNEDDLAAILFLWQNQDTVVIGRNQNAWRECQTGLLESEGGRLARRTTGGGAVFHDLGNLNFSLILPRRQFDLDHNFEMLIAAVATQGIHAERSGRNDVLVNGRKFSGNAFSLRGDVGLHHGTLLVCSDYARVSRYLTVAPAKLQAKGVASVQSRIINLAELNPTISVQAMTNVMEDAFLAVFGPLARGAVSKDWQVLRTTDADYQDEPRLLDLTARFESWNWRYGETIQFDVEVSKRMAWGMVEIGLKVENGCVSQAVLYSDALDSDFIEILAKLLLGCHFHSVDLAAALLKAPNLGEGFGPSRDQMVNDLADMIMEEGW